jgi:hypothetical protein
MKKRNVDFLKIDEARKTKLFAGDEIMCNWNECLWFGSYIRVEKNKKYGVVYSVYWNDNAEVGEEYFATFVRLKDAYSYAMMNLNTEDWGE